MEDLIARLNQSTGRYLDEWVLSGVEAAEWARHGYITFGPGPRGWMWNDEHGGAQYTVMSHTEGMWHLRKAREWLS